MIHISDISWTKRVRHPSEVFQKGETVEAVVLTIDSVNRRVSLGIKQLERDPWANIGEKYPVGEYVEGDVIRITPYGAIVKLEDDIEGLLHISEIAGRRINRVDDVLDPGDRIKVKIINVSPKDRRINLSLWQYQNETGDKGVEKGAGLATLAAEKAKAEEAAAAAKEYQEEPAPTKAGAKETEAKEEKATAPGEDEEGVGDAAASVESPEGPEEGEEVEGAAKETAAEGETAPAPGEEEEKVLDDASGMESADAAQEDKKAEGLAAVEERPSETAAGGEEEEKDEPSDESEAPAGDEEAQGAEAAGERPAEEKAEDK